MLLGDAPVQKNCHLMAGGVMCSPYIALGWNPLHTWNPEVTLAILNLRTLYIYTVYFVIYIYILDKINIYNIYYIYGSI